MKIPIIISILLFAGCALIHKSSGPQASAGQSLPLQTATSSVATEVRAVDDSIEKVKATTALRDAKAVAVITNAKTSNALNPDGHPKTIVDMDLELALDMFPGTQPDPEIAAVLMQNNALVQQGRAEAALEANHQLQTNVEALNSSLAEQKAAQAAEVSKRDQALADQHTKLDTFVKETTDNQIAADKAYNEEKAKIAKAQQDKQAFYLNITGGVFLLIFGLGVGFGNIAGLKIVYPFGLLALGCLGLAQLVTQEWFMYAVSGIVFLGLGVLAVWLYGHYKKGDLLQATQAQSVKLQTTLNQVVPVLDQAYENADTSAQKILDDTVFSKLATKMSSPSKEVIHLVRAGLQKIT